MLKYLLRHLIQYFSCIFWKVMTSSVYYYSILQTICLLWERAINEWYKKQWFLYISAKIIRLETPSRQLRVRRKPLGGGSIWIQIISNLNFLWCTYKYSWYQSTNRQVMKINDVQIFRVLKVCNWWKIVDFLKLKFSFKINYIIHDWFIQ